jgi:hypothetical protein
VWFCHLEEALMDQVCGPKNIWAGGGVTARSANTLEDFTTWFREERGLASEK